MLRLYAISIETGEIFGFVSGRIYLVLTKASKVKSCSELLQLPPGAPRTSLLTSCKYDQLFFCFA